MDLIFEVKVQRIGSITSMGFYEQKNKQLILNLLFTQQVEKTTKCAGKHIFYFCIYESAQHA